MPSQGPAAAAAASAASAARLRRLQTEARTRGAASAAAASASNDARARAARKRRAPDSAAAERGDGPLAGTITLPPEAAADLDARKVRTGARGVCAARSCAQDRCV